MLRRRVGSCWRWFDYDLVQFMNVNACYMCCVLEHGLTRTGFSNVVIHVARLRRCMRDKVSIFPSIWRLSSNVVLLADPLMGCIIVSQSGVLGSTRAVRLASKCALR